MTGPCGIFNLTGYIVALIIFCDGNLILRLTVNINLTAVGVECCLVLLPDCVEVCVAVSVIIAEARNRCGRVCRVTPAYEGIACP